MGPDRAEERKNKIVVRQWSLLSGSVMLDTHPKVPERASCSLKFPIVLVLNAPVKKMKTNIFEQCQKLFPEWADSPMEELFDPENLCEIANELYRFHQLKPSSLPQEIFFELLHNKWGPMAKYVLAALPLAIEPIQKIRFIPYAHQRFAKFLRTYEQRFGE